MDTDRLITDSEALRALGVGAYTEAELRYIVALHRRHGAPNPQASLSRLINYILCAVAHGSCRPGSWERGMLESMGLVALDGHDHNLDLSPVSAAPAAEGPDPVNQKGAYP